MSIPRPKGPERRIFREHIRDDPIDPQTNGPQVFYGLRYHIHITRPEEKSPFTIRSAIAVGARNRLDHAS